MNFFDHIDDYKNGLLRGEALRLFEAALENDVDLRAAVDNYDAAKGISEGLLELDVMGVIEGLAAEGKEVKTTVFSLWKFLVAASVVGSILLGGRWLTQQRPAANIKDNYVDKLEKEKSIDSIGYIFVETKDPAIRPISIHIINYDELYEVLKSPVLASNMRSSKTSKLNEKAIVQKADNYYAEGNFNAGKKILLDSISNRNLSRYWMAELSLKYVQIDSAIYYLSYLHYKKMRVLSRKKNRIVSLQILAAVKKGDDDKARRLCTGLPRRDYEKVYEILGIPK